MDQKLFIAFAKFEENQKEHDRARVIYKYALDNMDKEQCSDLYKAYTIHEKKFGERAGIENVIISKRKFQYEEEVKDMRRRWSSGEGEDEVVLPEQIKPSLSSEDDIEEPMIEEIRVRTKVVKDRRGTQKRPSKPPKATNKTRVSLPVRERNSDDDFL